MIYLHMYPMPQDDQNFNGNEKEDESANDHIIDMSSENIDDVDNDIASALKLIGKYEYGSDEDEDENEAEISAEPKRAKPAEVYKDDELIRDDDEDVEEGPEKPAPPKNVLKVDKSLLEEKERTIRQLKKRFRESEEEKKDLKKMLHSAGQNVKALKKKIDQERQRIEELEKQTGELNDRWVRVNADYVNYQKRSRSKMKEFVEIEKNALIRSILPVADNFKRALQETVQKHDDDGSFREGVELIYRQIRDVFKSWGVTEIPALNEPFDPYLHEAMERACREDVPDNIIVDVYSTGYFIGEKVLIPAKVVVNLNVKAESAEPADTREKTPSGESGENETAPESGKPDTEKGAAEDENTDHADDAGEESPVDDESKVEKKPDDVINKIDLNGNKVQ